MTKIKFIFKFLLLSGAIFGMFFGIGAGLTGFVKSANLNSQEPAEESTIEEGHRLNILVLGVDARPGDTHSRSDTMMLVSIDPEVNKIALISIPRDTRVFIHGNTPDKINAANSYGGPKLAVQCVEQLMDINIDNYVEMDFTAFKKVVDIMGGVTYNVPQRMYKPSEDIDLQPGIQKLNGRQALALVRFREYVMGDIQRTSQQQDFIKVLAAEMLKTKNIVKLPVIAKQTIKYVDTDLTVADMIKLASWAPKFKADAIVSQTLPGKFYNEYDSYGNLSQSFWQADGSQLQGLLDNMLVKPATEAVSQSDKHQS